MMICVLAAVDLGSLGVMRVESLRPNHLYPSSTLAPLFDNGPAIYIVNRYF